MSVATPRVLVVSESRITRRVVEMTFADQPLQLVACTSAASAAGELRTRPPALLLADITLQGTNGYGLAQLLRAHPDGPKAVAILLAGQTETIDEAAAGAAQVSAVLRKPLDSHQLVDAVRQALRSGPPPRPAAAAPVPLPAAAAPAEPAPVVETVPVISSEEPAAVPDAAAVTEMADGETAAGVEPPPPESGW